MCNYMGHRVSREEYITLKGIEKEFGVDVALELLRSGFDYSEWPILKPTADKKDFTISKAHWEFIPWWIKDIEQLKEARKQGIPWLNATAEKLLDSKMFRDAALNRRCLVIASHFYEWRHFKPENSKKDIAYPYLVTVPEQNYFYMAGIWQPWTDKSTGEMMDTFAIVTTKANDLMERVHNKKKRMPTILPDELAFEWLMEDISEERIKEIASYQFPSELMLAKTIAKDFRTNDNPMLPFEYEELPDLDFAV